MPGVPRARALGLRWADLAASTHGHLQGDTESVQVRAKLALAQDFTGGDISSGSMATLNHHCAVALQLFGALTGALPIGKQNAR